MSVPAIYRILHYGFTGRFCCPGAASDLQNLFLPWYGCTPAIIDNLHPGVSALLLEATHICCRH